MYIPIKDDNFINDAVFRDKHANCHGRALFFRQFIIAVITMLGIPFRFDIYAVFDGHGPKHFTVFFKRLVFGGNGVSLCGFCFKSRLAGKNVRKFCIKLHAVGWLKR